MPGKVKTRLSGKLGKTGAASLHQKMTQHVLDIARELANDDIAVEVHFAGGGKALMERVFSSDFPFVKQKGADLGERMLHSFSQACCSGSTRVVLIGTDCPGITRGTVLTAFDLLETNDCVFGPAYDGGYYLIGLKQAIPALFENIPWSDETTLQKTRERALRHKLSHALTEKLHDVDRPEDLEVWEEVKAAKSLRKISVIIPVLNEEAHILRTIESLKHGKNIEIIVVDGGSSDATAYEARLGGARVISGGKGRAAQMNHGALHASGEILLFIHGDTIVPEGYDREVREALRDTDVAAGAFSLHFDNLTLPVRIIEKGANIRSRFLGLPYGDQGLFISSELFRTVQGFPEMGIMEDVAFIRKIRAWGRVVILDSVVTTSARRYVSLGALRTWVMNQCVLAGFFLGVPAIRIEELYRLQRGSLVQWFLMVFSGLKNRCERSFRRVMNSGS